MSFSHPLPTDIYRLSCASLALFLGACAAPKPAEPPRASAPIATEVAAPKASATPAAASTPMRFAWPVGTRIRVAENTVNTTGDERTVLAMSYVLVVDRAPEGLRIRATDVRVERSELPDGDDKSKAFLMFAGGIKPDLLVGTDGTFVRAELDDARALKRLSDVAGPPPPNAPKEAKEVADAMLQGLCTMALELAKANAKEDWEDLVTLWSGRSPDALAHAPVPTERSHTLGMLGPTAFLARSGSSGLTACAPPSGGSCAQLTSTSTLVETKLVSAATRRLDVVADPATLLPRSTVSELDMTISLGDKLPTVASKTRVERTFTRL